MATPSSGITKQQADLLFAYAMTLQANSPLRTAMIKVYEMYVANQPDDQATDEANNEEEN